MTDPAPGAVMGDDILRSREAGWPRGSRRPPHFQYVLEFQANSLLLWILPCTRCHAEPSAPPAFNPLPYTLPQSRRPLCRFLNCDDVLESPRATPAIQPVLRRLYPQFTYKDCVGP